MAKAFTADIFIADMSSRLGLSGEHVWKKYKLPSGTAYCAGEISYTMDHIGHRSKWYGGRPVFYVPYAQVWMENNWKTVYSGPKRKGSLSNVKKGDIVIFSWTKWSRDHIGAVYNDGSYKNESNQVVIDTIEGNTSGGKVALRWREKKYIHSVYRPPYTADTTVLPPYTNKLPVLPERGYFKRGDDGAQVKSLQKFLNWATGYGLDVDGELGALTVRAVVAYQSMHDLTLDGEFGKKCLKKAQALVKKYSKKKSEPKSKISPGGKIGKKAIEVAWPYGTSKSKYSYPNGAPTKEFKKALEKAYPDRSKWGKQTRAGASCDVVAGTIIRASGVDKSFPRGLDDDYGYFAKHKDKWSKVNISKKSELQMGDVIIYRKKTGGGHICIYIGNGRVVEGGYKTKRYACTTKLIESRLKTSYIKKTYDKFGVYRAK